MEFTIHLAETLLYELNEKLQKHFVQFLIIEVTENSDAMTTKCTSDFFGDFSTTSWIYYNLQ